ncbi:MAG: nucleotide sugar dehydrogenase [Limnohabitans sp.]
MSRVIIIGAGYVGLTLGVASARVGHEVFFVEINPDTVSKLNQRKATFYEAGLQESLDTLFAGRADIAFASLDALYQAVAPGPAVYVVSLGTPLGANSKALLGPVEAVIKDVAGHMTEDDLIVLRSTVAVGTSRHLLHSIPGITHLSFCPERTIEGKALEELSTLPQIISGNSPQAQHMAEDYFRTITQSVITAASLETAELIKLASNSFRDLNFAFANLLALIAEQHGVNVNELITLANFRYDRNVIALPGLVGGPCLEKDAYILAQSFEGEHASLLLKARHLNETFVEKASDFIAAQGVSTNTKVLICGAAFKGRPVTSDVRGSFVFAVVKSLLQMGVQKSNIFILDPKVQEAIEGVPVVHDVASLEGPLDFMIQLTNHEMFETPAFDAYLAENCRHIVSFWPKQQTLNTEPSKHLFLGGLRSQ